MNDNKVFKIFWAVIMLSSLLFMFSLVCVILKVANIIAISWTIVAIPICIAFVIYMIIFIFLIVLFNKS